MIMKTIRISYRIADFRALDEMWFASRVFGASYQLSDATIRELSFGEGAEKWNGRRTGCENLLGATLNHLMNIACKFGEDMV